MNPFHRCNKTLARQLETLSETARPRWLEASEDELRLS